MPPLPVLTLIIVFQPPIILLMSMCFCDPLVVIGRLLRTPDMIVGVNPIMRPVSDIVAQLVKKIAHDKNAVGSSIGFSISNPTAWTTAAVQTFRGHSPNPLFRLAYDSVFQWCCRSHHTLVNSTIRTLDRFPAITFAKSP